MSSKPSGGARKSRRKSREFVVQGLYQWSLTASPVEEIERQLREEKSFASVDAEHFSTLLRGAISRAAELDELLQPHLDRTVKELSPVEHAILRLAGYEMQHHPEIPYRVVINEAVELAKSFGGTDGHKFVNGVLDKLAAQVRVAEVRAKS
jgi:N utilization substance protein B